MKTYATSLLEAWPDDRGQSRLIVQSASWLPFPRLQPEAIATLAWIIETARTINEQDDTVFDRLYRRGHVLSGMVKLAGLPKVTHPLVILDFALDLGRSLQTFVPHSLGYVVSLLASMSIDILQDFQTLGSCDRDLTDIIEECRTYLDVPMKQRLLPTPPAERRREEDSTVREVVEVAEVGPVTLPVREVPAYDDGPEELDIPSDKIGLISDFCEEARESLARVGNRLVELEGADDPLPLVNELFRSVHTVKGGARLLKIGKMESLAHLMESRLDEVRKGTRHVSAELLDVLLDGQKLLDAMVDEVASRGPVNTRIGPLLAALDGLATGAPTTTKSIPHMVEKAPPESAPPVINALPVKPETSARQPASSDHIRIPTEKLDDVLNTASEIFISRIRLASDVAAISGVIRQSKQSLQRLEEFNLDTVLDRLADSNRRLVTEVRALFSGQVGRISPEKLPKLVQRFHQELSADARQRGFPAPEELMLNLLSIEEIRKRLQKNVEHMEQLSSRLQTGAMGFRMVPISQLFDRFPTQVREMARQMGKKVRLEVSGSETELDKVMINQLTDPLLHILRNSIDHGIESPEERVAQGKPESGQIDLRAYYHGSHAVIEVRDDGKGIDADRVLAKAIKQGLVDADKAAGLTRPEILEFIFEPGLSTAEKVSTMSGRGVGMDVVKTAITHVQGNVTIDSKPGEGTILKMKLPLTLAVVGILRVREQGQQFAFPIQHVEEILAVTLADTRRVGMNTIYNHRGTTLPVTTLSNVLDFPPSLFAGREVSLVILSDGEKKVGVLVDEVLGRQEVLIKNLGRLIKKAPYLMGCTILSDSRLVLILNAWEILNARSRKPMKVATVAREQGTRKQHSVLIVDDSAIQRNHLSSLLSQAGYMVETAENGFEGLKKLRNRRHSAFCVDIAMPLMDGFEFVERLRGLPAHAESPVLFITGRTSPAERERAANLGVREYFEKPIDPDLLMRTLDRLCSTTTAHAHG